MLTGGSCVRVGPYYTVDVHEIEKGFGLTKLTNLFKHGRISTEQDRNGIWQHDSGNSRLVRQRNPGKDTIGDIRVTYRVLNQFDGIGSREVTATVCGVPQGNRITNWGPLSGSVMAGKTDRETFLNKTTK